MQDVVGEPAGEGMNRGAKSDAESTFAFIAEHTSDVIVRVDNKQIVTYVSPSIRAYGYRPDELIGTSGVELIHPDDRGKFIANTATLLRGETTSPLDREHRFRKADGEWIWVEGAPHIVFDKVGAPVEIVNIFRDVTYRRAAEALTNEQAQLFETAFQQSAIGKCLMGIDGRFLRVNAAFCRLTGYSEAELLVLSGADLGHAEDLGRPEEDHDRLLAGEIDSYSSQRRSRRLDGSYIWVEFTVALARQSDGTPKHLVVEIQDLTGRLAAETALASSERRYRMIAENTSDIIAMSDGDGRVTYLSPSIRQLGFEPEELLGKTFAAHVHPDDDRRMLGILMRQQRGAAVERVRWRARHKASGAWVWMESAPARLWDPVTGEAIGFLDVVRDITVQIKQEEALVAARAEAEAATTVKSQFLANMSHEIRTPLTTVLGYTDILSATPGLNEEVRSHVRRIAGAGSVLLAIINDILDFSKLEAGMIDVRPRSTDIGKLAEDTVALFEARASEKALTISVDLAPDVPAAVMLDSDRLRQILVNLIGNAVKFTDQGRVTLSVATAEDGQCLRFEVEDTGPGLDPEQCARLFQRFNQIDGATTRQHGGSGLGLAICKGLAEAMGGAVGVTSTPGAGSIFHLTLPLATVVADNAPAPAADIGSISGMRVLVVDDNATNRELARRILEAFGAEVAEADGGAEALEQLSTAPIDVVLMDLRMPGVDGHEALKRLRASDGLNRHTPVLAFTADAEVGGDAGLEAFDGVVRKPINTLAMAGSVALAAAGAGSVREIGDGVALRA